MAAKRRVIDIDGSPEVIRLVDQLIESQKGVLLRRNGSIVAEIVPLQTRVNGRLRKLDPAETERIRRETVDSWKGLIESDQPTTDVLTTHDPNRQALPDL